MSYAILKWKLPDEAHEFREAQRAGDYLACLEEFARWIRAEEKHGDRREIPTEEVHETFWRICGERNVDPCGVEA